MPRSQKAADRPIAFALHDMARNQPQEIFQLSIRPEDLTRSEASRLMVHQTLGGAWADNFGPGVSSVTIAGTTGWGAGNLPDGFEQFQKLHSTVFERWHSLRAEVAKEGKDPDLVKLIFSDGLDEFVWAVAPQAFVLKRNKSRPLLSQYQITMVKLADAVLEKPQKGWVSGEGLESGAGLSSLDKSIAKINEFAKNIKGAIASALGPLKAGIDKLVKLTSSALSAVRSLAAAGMNVVQSAMAPVMEIAQGLTKVASNVFGIVSNIQGLAMGVKNTFMQVGAAFRNAFCLLRNVFKLNGFLPQYMGLYGSSYCSSTAGGSPISPYINTNVFPRIFPAAASAVAMTATAEKAVGALANADPLKPPSTGVLGGLLNTINNGVNVSIGAVDKMIAAAKKAPAGPARSSGSSSEQVSYDYIG